MYAFTLHCEYIICMYVGIGMSKFDQGCGFGVGTFQAARTPFYYSIKSIVLRDVLTKLSLQLYRNKSTNNFFLFIKFMILMN